MSRTVEIYLTHSLADLQEPYLENLQDPYRGQFTWAVPWKSSWPIPWPIWMNHAVKIHMSYSVAEPYLENLHDPFLVIYMSRTVNIYMTRSVSNLHGPYCENLRGPFRDQSTWAVPWKSTRPIPCSVDRSRIVTICMSLAITNLDDAYVHQYIFGVFTLEDIKSTQHLRQVCLTDI